MIDAEGSRRPLGKINKNAQGFDRTENEALVLMADWLVGRAKVWFPDTTECLYELNVGLLQTYQKHVQQVTSLTLGPDQTSFTRAGSDFLAPSSVQSLTGLLCFNGSV